jgi:hypothetical protein
MTSHGTRSRLGNQPLGIHRGMGLNEVNLRTGALAAEIARAVADSGGTASRRDIFARFADRAPKSVIYRHIASVLDATGAMLAPTKLPPRRPGITEAEQEAELTEAMPEVEAIERLVAGGEVPPAEPVLEEIGPLVLEEIGQPVVGESTAGPVSRVVEQARAGRLMVEADGEIMVDIAAGMVRALWRAEKLMIKAEHEDGEIRNARLMVVAIDLYGKTAERKARVDADLSDSSQLGAYLRAITNAVLAEPAEVKARILARMRGVNAQWGM